MCGKSGKHIYTDYNIMNYMPSRNCGETRVQNGLYLAVESSPFGKPVEYFLLDPVVPTDFKPFRTPIIVERKDGSKINDIFVYIGKQFYPFVPDYIEETRMYGISRRIPKDFPFERLTPYKSRMFFVHERAIPLFGNKVQQDCQRKIRHKKSIEDSCVFDLWPLSSLQDFEEKHKVRLVDSWTAEIRTKSVEYTVHLPTSPQMNLEQKKKYPYHMGIFAAFFVGHLEFVNKDKKMPSSLKKRIKETDFDIQVCEE